VSDRQNSTEAGALAHIRVVESGDIPASYATRHLADLGHVSLLEDGLAKVQDGTTSLSEIRRMGATGVAWRESATITK